MFLSPGSRAKPRRYTPEARMVRNTVLSQVYNGVFVKVPLNQVTFDTTGGRMIDLVNGQFTIVYPGNYLVAATMYLPGQVAGQNVDAAITVNGAQVALSRTAASTTGDGAVTVADTFAFTPGTTVSFYASASSTASLSTSTSTLLQPRMSIYQIK